MGLYEKSIFGVSELGVIYQWSQDCKLDGEQVFSIPNPCRTCVNEVYGFIKVDNLQLYWMRIYDETKNKGWYFMV